MPRVIIDGTPENLYQNIGKVGGEFGESVEKKLIEGAEMAVLSRDLAHIHDDAPIAVILSDLEFSGFNGFEGLNLLKGLGFKSLLKRFGHEELLDRPRTGRKKLQKKPAEKPDGQISLI